jgi:hypothetical protein
MAGTNLIDLEIFIHAETDLAILASLPGDDEEPVWLPLSQIEINERHRSSAEITLPEWLALDRGLI